MRKRISNFEKFNENQNQMFKNLDDLMSSFNITEIDYEETDINDFVHDIDDFDSYIINDENIKVEKEIVAFLNNDNEIFIYTDINNNIHGWAIIED